MKQPLLPVGGGSADPRLAAALALQTGHSLLSPASHPSSPDQCLQEGERKRDLSSGQYEKCHHLLQVSQEDRKCYCLLWAKIEFPLQVYEHRENYLYNFGIWRILQIQGPGALGQTFF